MANKTNLAAQIRDMAMSKKYKNKMAGAPSPAQPGGVPGGVPGAGNKMQPGKMKAAGKGKKRRPVMPTKQKKMGQGKRRYV